jgi:predicted PurR-regulated permease PerM
MIAPAAGSRRFLLALLLGAIALFVYVASPFASPLLVAATLAAVLQPLHVRLTGVLKGRHSISAALLTLAVLLAIAGPVAYLASTLVGQVVAAVRWLREALASEGVAGLIARLPEQLQGIAARVNQEVPQLIDRLREHLGASDGAAALGGVISATGAMVAKTLIMVVALYFLLAEGRRLVEWLEEATPLTVAQVRELLGAFNGAVVAVVVSTFATAGVQAVLALIGYLVAGVPQPVFFAFLTFLAALVPLVGAGIVTLPIAGLLAATGRPVAGGLLALWSVVAVGSVDNVLKPVLMRRGLAVHVSLVFLALLGGLATFGPIGLIVGPLALAFFLATMRIWRREESSASRAAAAPAVTDDASAAGIERSAGG